MNGLFIPFQLLQKKKPKTIHGDMTPIHGRVTNIRVRTSVPIGIQQLSQQVQVLINTVLAIQEQLCSLLYNKQKSQPTALSRQLQIQKKNRKNNMPSRYHTPTLHIS
jgi:hypothetical protein